MAMLWIIMTNPYKVSEYRHPMVLVLPDQMAAIILSSNVVIAIQSHLFEMGSAYTQRQYVHPMTIIQFHQSNCVSSGIDHHCIKCPHRLPSNHRLLLPPTSRPRKLKIKFNIWIATFKHQTLQQPYEDKNSRSQFEQMMCVGGWRYMNMTI